MIDRLRINCAVFLILAASCSWLNPRSNAAATSLSRVRSLGKVAVFGASGGVGQQICSSLRNNGYDVVALSRSIDSLGEYPLLAGCDFRQCDARVIETIGPAILDCNNIIISVGTTAFPTKKWKDGNVPKAACFDTVQNIITTLEQLPTIPENVILLSSIGVERTGSFPFKILNSYGVLDEKRKSEKVLLDSAKRSGYRGIVCRPGRLVGEPFTNFDLAKLLNIDQGDNKGIVIDKRDVLVGDVERMDVASSIVNFLEVADELTSLNIVYSIINKPGPAPTPLQWGKLLSMYTVPDDEIAFTRRS